MTVDPDQCWWGVCAFVTVLKVNTENTRSDNQLMSSINVSFSLKYVQHEHQLYNPGRI